MPQGTLPTQQFVDVEKIEDGVVYLKNGGLRKILMIGGVNFDLKSGEEQEVILNSFQHFLNTLDFSVQFFIHSRKVNVDGYLEKIKARKTEENNELLKIQIDDYVEFVKSFVQDNPIISKGFFVVVPYDTLQITGKVRGVMGFFSRKSGATQKTEERVAGQKNLLQLSQRVDEVSAGLETVGLQTKALDDEALTELFYNLYNPQIVEKKGLEILKTSH